MPAVSIMSSWSSLKFRIESSWVKIREQVNKGNFVVSVYYRHSDQEEERDEESLCQLWESSCLQALSLVGDLTQLQHLVKWPKKLQVVQETGQLRIAF